MFGQFNHRHYIVMILSLQFIYHNWTMPNHIHNVFYLSIYIMNYHSSWLMMNHHDSNTVPGICVWTRKCHLQCKRMWQQRRNKNVSCLVCWLPIPNRDAKMRIQIHCTMWCLQSMARTSWFSHGHAKRHRVHAARRWMCFLQRQIEAIRYCSNLKLLESERYTALERPWISNQIQSAETAHQLDVHADLHRIFAYSTQVKLRMTPRLPNINHHTLRMMFPSRVMLSVWKVQKYA